jgi:hypothetical protein
VNHGQSEAYFIPRKNIIFDVFMQKAGWWPDFQLRFFKKGVVTWTDTIHSVPTVHGKVEYLAQEEQLALTHHNYQSIGQYLSRMDRYTTIQASESLLASVDTSELIKTFSDEFLSRLFLHEGINAGMHGVGLSFLQGFSNLVVALKIWEGRGFPETQADQRKTIVALYHFTKDLQYWIADWEVKHARGLKKWVFKFRRKWQA